MGKDKMITARGMLRNVGISILAQVVSLVVSILINLVVPKFINEYQYSYWQTYVLYVGYVGIFHFGILDGIMLRYSQYDYDELDRTRIRSQFHFILLLNTIISLAIIVFSWLISTNQVTKQIFFFVALGVISKNIFTYSSYTYQMTNRISLYVRLIIIQRGIYALGTILLLVFKLQYFYLFCIVDLLADFGSVILLSSNNKGLYFGKALTIQENIIELKNNISNGVLLLIANWASMLLVGEAKMFVQWHWDTLVFGKVSFAFSVSNLFLTFVTAASIVLFPSLKRMDINQLPIMYKKIRNGISPILFIILLTYFPGCWILSKWLPKYTDSLRYLGILLPIIVFTSKVSLLTNNYLKAYRKEVIMLKINVVSICAGTLLYAFSTYVINSIDILLISTLGVIMFRSIYSEIVVMNLIKTSFSKEFIVEGIVTILFVICTLFDLRIGFCIYLFILSFYLYLNRDFMLKLLKGRRE